MTKKPKKSRKAASKRRPARRALTHAQELEVAAAFLAGESQPDLAERFGVAVNTVARCLRRHGASAATREGAGGGKADPDALELYRAVGLPPLGNTLGSSGWMHRALIAMAAQAMTDTTLTEKQRRKDMVALARASTGAFPLAVLDEATKLIGKERGLLKEFDVGPQTVSAAELDARVRAAGREPMKSIWVDRTGPRSTESPEKLDS